MSRESHDEQIRRVEGMASGDPTWDLSDNDIAALKTVLKDRAQCLKWLKWYTESGAPHPDARIAVGEAEGKRMKIELPFDRIGV